MSVRLKKEKKTREEKKKTERTKQTYMPWCGWYVLKPFVPKPIVEIRAGRAVLSVSQSPYSIQSMGQKAMAQSAQLYRKH